MKKVGGEIGIKGEMIDGELFIGGWMIDGELFIGSWLIIGREGELFISGGVELIIMGGDSV